MLAARGREFGLPPPHSLVEIELLILCEKILSSIPSARSECGNGNVLQAGDALWSLSLSHDSPWAVAFEMTAQFGRGGRLWRPLGAGPGGGGSWKPPKPSRDTRGFSRMTLSSHRLKASSSFFTAKAGQHPFLRPRDVGTTPAGQPGGSVLLRAPPMYTAGSCYDNCMGLAWCWKR